MKDICAVSTPLAEGGISVIRISGENAISIGAKVFKPLSCKSVENMAGYSCAYGKIVDKNGREVDDGVLTVSVHLGHTPVKTSARYHAMAEYMLQKKFSDFALNRVQSLLRGASSQRGLFSTESFHLLRLRA